MLDLRLFGDLVVGTSIDSFVIVYAHIDRLLVSFVMRTCLLFRFSDEIHHGKFKNI